jgi:hypothetical protein
LAFARGQLATAEELARAALDTFVAAPTLWLPCAALRIRALMGLSRVLEARVLAEQATAMLQTVDGAGCAEVTVRLAVAEAFEATGDRERARTELAETLHQVQLRLDDIADPFWKNSYLTRNNQVAHALALGQEWGLSALPATGG